MKKVLSSKAILVFFKAQFSAFAGGIVDYAIMIFCTEVLSIHYTISIAISGVIGAVVNFSINRFWTFKKGNLPVGGQLVKFCLVVLGSIALKSSFTYLLTENLHLDYKISRILIDIAVSLGFNYTLQKYWVFGNTKKEENLTSSVDQ
ncbi:GtrA family protein [Olivibacter sitiensis]|uniref:GtrA family protein n=1 Tax=Olivibacter sitiensis TaxID=376470 RepID=UPI000426DB21|nr:GtrA family protein [Olivibacter sitiensis]